MLLPESMSKILVVGTKDQLPATIDLLYSLENVHVIDFPADGEEGFTLGSPLSAASDASLKLLKLRSMEKDLEIEGHTYSDKISVKEIEESLQSTMDEIERQIAGIVESKNSMLARLSELNTRIASLDPFKKVDLDLELYRGYSSLGVIAGYSQIDPETALKDALQNEYELFKGSNSFIVLFVALSKLEEAQRVLSQQGFSEVPIPEGKGMPSQMVAELQNELADVNKQLEDIEAKLAEIRGKYAPFITAADEHLSIIVEKAELPLRMGATEHSFVLEAWVPEKEFGSISDAFNKKVGDNVYLEVLYTKERKEEHAEASGYNEEEPVEVEEEVPVELKHGKTVGRFTFFTKLLSTPRYNEIDPTITVAIFFPIFFGLMVGDVGYGIPFTVLGLLGLKRCKSEEWRGIATMLFYGGLTSIFFGLFLYGDMFGIEFHAAEVGALSWETLLGVSLPHVLFNVGDFAVQLGYVTKLGSVKLLLYACVWVGIAHLLLGLIIGFYNTTIRHGIKEAVFEKLSWILMFVGFAVLIPWLVDNLLSGSGEMNFTDISFIAGIVLFVVGLLMAFKAEGGTAIIEAPEVLSNVLSYTRIAAIGMSKAGMALAFNMIALEMMAPGGGIMLVAGLGIFILGHLMIFILAIISAGLHSIRVEYVELFNRFFEGGGVEFNPLKIVRKHTITTMED